MRFAAVSGSTRLHDTMGDAAALEANDLCARLLAEQHSGRVVNAIGDEVMAIFAPSVLMR